MVESVALEMRSAGNGTEGSNPSLTSTIFYMAGFYMAGWLCFLHIP